MLGERGREIEEGGEIEGREGRGRGERERVL